MTTVSIFRGYFNHVQTSGNFFKVKVYNNISKGNKIPENNSE